MTDQVHHRMDRAGATPATRRSSSDIVVPVYRNADTLEEILKRIGSAMGNREWQLRLVVDGCPAGSAAVARSLADADERVHALCLPVNVGQHAAIVAGLATPSDADTWVCLDADLQDPPEAIPVLLDALDSAAYSGVFAGRRGDYESRGRRITGDIHRRAMRSLTGLPLDAGAFMAMDTALRDAIVTGVRVAGSPSVVAAAGASRLPLTSIPIARARRQMGRSAWTSRARVRQAATSLAWAARHSARRS